MNRPTEQSVVAALLEVPLEPSSIQVRQDHGGVLFGIFVTSPDAMPSGGCICGAVSETAVSVDLGGIIMDGGWRVAEGN
ncbi:hypothetical protein [Microbacterium sp. 18062]|uniref:hypothetical protein n=1 Tax=Microbacterium sp. 18062 TaxID=2681410 RepID=UPI00135948B6|nr:hypothetical protein [Microbacterium sp. 18062]